MTTFNFLHLTDLHFGMHDQSWMWPTLEREFFNDLEVLHDSCGHFDAILFTGDLVYSGSTNEYDGLTILLSKLYDKLRSLGSNPILLTVPGNHDITRPRPSTLRSKLISDWDFQKKIEPIFWTNDKLPHRRFVSRCLQNYQDWTRTHPFPRVSDMQAGNLPGDFSAIVRKNNISIGIVGLNTTFLQFASGDCEGKLALHGSQINGVCPQGVNEWFDNHSIHLLMTHQPPTWLTPRSLNSYLGEVNPPGRFLAHLYGHMHRHIQSNVQEGGDIPRRYWQSASLFGLEQYGHDLEIDRRHGYMAGQIQVLEGMTSIRLWPRMATQHQSGAWHIAQDTTSTLERDGGTYPEISPTRRLRASLIHQGVTSTFLSLPNLLSIINYIENIHHTEVRELMKALYLLGPQIPVVKLREFGIEKMGRKFDLILSDLQQLGYMRRHRGNLEIAIDEASWLSIVDSNIETSYRNAIEWTKRFDNIDFICKRLSLAIKSKELRQTRLVLEEYGYYLIDTGNYDLIRKGLGVLGSKRIAFLHNLIEAKSLEHQGDMMVSSKLYRRALRTKNFKVKGLALYGLANIAIALLDFDLATNYNTQLGEVSSNTDSQLLKGHYLHQKAYLHLRDPRMKSFPVSLKLFLESLEIYERLYDCERISDTLYHIGEIYVKSDDLLSAETTIRRAIALAKRGGFERVRANALMALACIHVRCKRPVQSLKCFRDAEASYRMMGLQHKQQLAFVGKRMVQIYLSGGDYAMDARVHALLKRITDSFPPIYAARAMELIALCRGNIQPIKLTGTSSN